MAFYQTLTEDEKLNYNFKFQIQDKPKDDKRPAITSLGSSTHPMCAYIDIEGKTFYQEKKTESLVIFFEKCLLLSNPQSEFEAQ